MNTLLFLKLQSTVKHLNLFSIFSSCLNHTLCCLVQWAARNTNTFEYSNYLVWNCLSWFFFCRKWV